MPDSVWQRVTPGKFGMASNTVRAEDDRGRQASNLHVEPNSFDPASTVQQETSNKTKVQTNFGPGKLPQYCRVPSCFEPLVSCLFLIERSLPGQHCFSSTFNLLSCCPRSYSARTVLDAVPNLLGVTRWQTESGKLAALVANVYSTGVP